MAAKKRKGRNGEMWKKGIKVPAPAEMTPDALKRIREELGLTQQELAEQLDVQPLTISFWETGRTPINRVTAMAIQTLVSRGVKPKAKASA